MREVGLYADVSNCPYPITQQKKDNFLRLRVHYCYLLIIIAVCFSTTIILTMVNRENAWMKLCIIPNQVNSIWIPSDSNLSRVVTNLLTMKPGNPITIQCNRGRLGNQMCTMATLYGLATLNQRNLALLSCHYDKLSPIFDFNVSVINATLFNKTNPWPVVTYLRSRDHFIDKKTNIIIGYLYPCSYTFFHHVLNDIKKIFKFKPDIKAYAKDALKSINAPDNSVTVGVHVRRTDYLKNTKNSGGLSVYDGREVDMEYFEKATNYFRSRYDNVIFLAVSDDRQWCRENLEPLGIQVMPDSPGPGYDLAILADCDHLIMTYGTYGLWAAYLNGGTVTYFDKFLDPDPEFKTEVFFQDKMYLPEWVGIETKSSYKYDRTR